MLIDEVALVSQGLPLWAVTLSKSFIAFLYRVSRIVPVTLMISLLENHCKTSTGRKRSSLSVSASGDKGHRVEDIIVLCCFPVSLTICARMLWLWTVIT